MACVDKDILEKYKTLAEEQEKMIRALEEQDRKKLEELERLKQEKEIEKEKNKRLLEENERLREKCHPIQQKDLGTVWKVCSSKKLDLDNVCINSFYNI